MQSVNYNILIQKLEFNESDVARTYRNQSKIIDQFNRDIRRLDVGVRSVELNSASSSEKEFWGQFHHEHLCRPVDPLFESHGTRQLFKLYPLISEAINKGSVAIIDELDSATHPVIVGEILNWFYDLERNHLNAQLWMSCHAASLLEELSKDEILFCEKTNEGTTEIFKLSEIQSVRRDENYYRKYFGGYYGALPRVG